MLSEDSKISFLKSRLISEVLCAILENLAGTVIVVRLADSSVLLREESKRKEEMWASKFSLKFCCLIKGSTEGYTPAIVGRME